MKIVNSYILPKLNRVYQALKQPLVKANEIKSVVAEEKTTGLIKSDTEPIISSAIKYTTETINSAPQTILIDGKITLPAKYAKRVSDPTTFIGRFFQSMRLNKKELMKDLDLDSNTYDSLALTALKISREESSYGTAKKFKILNRLEHSKIVVKLAGALRGKTRGDSCLSLGMTRLKVDKLTQEEKELLTKYGITFGDNISNVVNPEQSAIATMIHLAKLAKEYPEYVEIAAQLRPNTNSARVKHAISRAKKIIANDSLRKDAINCLRLPNGTIEEAKELKRLGLTQQDLADMRIYASTLELSPEAFLAAKWNGKKIIPQGKEKDIACANLLNTIAQKGYIANINTESKIHC